MAGVSRMDRVKNEVGRQRTGVEVDLATRVDMKVLRWFGHVERMEDMFVEESDECKSEWSMSKGETEVRMDG